MLNDSNPLLFIETISNVSESNKLQKTYDSRKKTSNHLKNKYTSHINNVIEKEGNNEKLQFIENRKLGNIIEMYKKGRPVLCSIVVGEEEIIGIPSKRLENILIININENDERQINLTDIDEINIIKF